MATALIVGVIALVGAIVARVTWRRAADERQSVQSHQHTLETLRHMADRREQAARPAPGPGGADLRHRPRPGTIPGGAARDGAARTGQASDSGNGAARRRGPAPATRRHGTTAPTPSPDMSPAEAPPTGGRPAPCAASAKAGPARRGAMVFVDDDARSPGIPANAWSQGAARPALRPPRPSGERTGPQARHRTVRVGIVAGVVVVAVVVGLALTLAPSHAPRTASGSHPGAAKTGAAHHLTTAPPATTVTPASQTAHTATYSAPGSPYTVVLDASGLCWVMATDTASGRVLWTGTMSAGETRSLSVTGDIAIRLGAASDVSVLMDGKAVQLPTGFQSPFTMTFQGP